MKLALAIVPSNQDHNIGIDGRSEMAQVAIFCDHVLAAFSKYPGITVKLFTPEPESTDAFEFETLYAIQKEVGLWLKSFSSLEYRKLATNWHTDSGFYSHVGGYYETYTPESKPLAELVTPVLNQWFNGSIAYGNYSGYIFAKSLKGIAPAVLYECGSHQMKADIEVLDKYGSVVASAVANTIATYYGQVPEGILSHLDIMWGYSNELDKASEALTLSAQALSAQAAAVRNAAAIMRERIVAIKHDLGLS